MFAVKRLYREPGDVEKLGLQEIIFVFDEIHECFDASNDRFKDALLLLDLVRKLSKLYKRTTW